MDNLLHNLRYASRSLSRSPLFTITVVLTLALGLGATTAIYSVVNAVLLQPLPYAEPERLVQIVEHVPAAEAFGGMAQRRTAMNVAELDDWRQASTLSHVAIIGGPEGHTLATEDGNIQVYGARVSPALFVMRGVPPLLGRGLLPEEERPDADVIVLGEALWRAQFGADPGIVGRTLVLDGRVLTIVGVMPPEFGDAGYWTPFVAPPPGPGFMFLGASARLADGVSIEAANAEINALGLSLRGVTEEPGAAPRFEVVGELDQIVARIVPTLRVLIGAVVAVLLIVCSNVANLLLVHGLQRQKDIAIRRSLGATRGGIVRLLLSESLLLAASAGLVAIGLAAAAVRLVKYAAVVDLPRRFAFNTAILPRVDEIAVDPGVLAFVGALVVVVGALVGLLPALRLARFGEKGHPAAAHLATAARTSRASHVLATVQLAFALALLSGAGLLLNSFLRLAAVDPGFDPRGVLSFELVVPGDATAARKLEVAEALAARLGDRPGITAAGFTDIPPLAAGLFITMGNFTPEGMTDAEMRDVENTLPPERRTQTRLVSPGYLRALGARLVAGSWLDDRSGRAELPVLVSQTYAQKYLPDRDAVGTTLRTNGRNATIVGVVDDIHLNSLEDDPGSVVFIDAGQFLPVRRATQPRGLMAQADRSFLTIDGSAITFAARTGGDPIAIMADLRAIARDIDPALAVDAAIPLEAVLAGVTTRPRFYAFLLGTFGVIAWFIAAIGIYGVLAYLVSQRTKEIGIRMALGAQRANVLQLVLRRGLAMTAIGIATGVLGALGLTRYLQGMLFGITALDPATYLVATAAFAAVALLASYLPARSATRVDPMATLRAE
ncbi:MAG: ABC transporter permease [Gammaproteobacteria bacterium]|nr:ABC transporter permease [Gammaproteobacteria bacterium]